MNGKPSFTIEQFYTYINDGKLMAGKCKRCGKVHLPPRPLCDKCLSNEFQWIEIPKKGRLLTYTIIHVPPPQFTEMAPYAVGIIQLDDGLKIPGLIREIDSEQIKIGMEMMIRFDESVLETKWPQWPRYYFRPAKE